MTILPSNEHARPLSGHFLYFFRAEDLYRLSLAA